VVISIGLITAKEADDLLALPPEQRAAAATGRAAGAAASTAVTAGPTGAAPLRQTPPGRLMQPGVAPKQ
jgi:hypothetical protein